MVCNINFGSLIDTSGYVDKLIRRGIPSGIYIKGSGQNNVFLLNDGASAFYGYTLLGWITGWYGTGEPRLNGKTGSNFYRDRGVNFEWQEDLNLTAPYITGGNLCALTTAGTHSDWPIGGGGRWMHMSQYCSLNGYNWFITSNSESYAGRMYEPNGTLNETFGNPRSAMFPYSFSGTSYDNCPVGFAGTCLEPGAGGVQHIDYFDYWIAGYPFIECCYYGLVGKDADSVFCGDPFVMIK
jgi:hypothetical protein